MIKRIKRVIKKILLPVYINIFGKKDYNKFVVITRSRTGSNLLISLLNSHKDINAYGEKFKKLGNKSCNKIFKQIFPNKSIKKCIGFKIFYSHPYDSSDGLIWDKLKNDKNIKVIHLVRENLLRVHISRLIAGKTNKWFNKDEDNIDVNNKKVNIDIEKLFQDFKETENHIKETRDIFQNHDIIEVKYEDLTKDKDVVIKKILQFLGISQMNLNSKHKKQNPEKIKDLVLNYEELYKGLINTQYAFMLRE